MSSKRCTSAVLALVAVFTFGGPTSLFSGSAFAEECDEEADENKSEGKNFHIETRNGEKVYVIDKEIAVCGKVPKPAVVYVLQARNINYEWASLKQDFLPKIFETVKKAPF